MSSSNLSPLLRNRNPHDQVWRRSSTTRARQHEEKIGVAEKRQQELEDQLQQLQKEHESSQEELNRVQQQLEAATQEQESSRSDLKTQLDDAARQHEEKIGVAEKRQRELEDQLQQLQKEHDETRNNAAHADSELSALQSKLEDAQGGTEILEKKIESLALESEQYRDSMQMLRDESGTHQQNLETALADAEQLKADLQKLEQERDQLQQQSATAASDVESLQADLATSSEKLEAASKKLTVADEKLSVANEKLSAGSEEDRRKIADMEKHIAEQRSHLERRDARLAELEQQDVSRQDMVAGIASLTAEKTGLTEQLSAANQTGDMTRRQLTALQEQVDRSSAEKKAIAERLEQSIAEKEAMEQQFKELSEQHVTQMETLQKKVAEIQRASSKSPTVRRDNLKRISGITPKIEKMLRAAGLDSFESLTMATAESLQNVIKEAGPRYKKLDPSSWSKQALMAAAGEWDQLKNFQEAE